MGKALQDDRLLDLPLARPLVQQLLLAPSASTPTPTLHDVARVDPSLGKALLEIQRMAQAAGQQQQDGGAGAAEKLGEYLAAFHLHFTLPGADWCVVVCVWSGRGKGRIEKTGEDGGSTDNTAHS